MRTIAKLFGRSPFVPLQAHMDKVIGCVDKVRDLFDAFFRGDHDAVEKIGEEISRLEHMADQVKNDLRSQLPKGMFLPVDKASLLEALGIQDSLADKAENIAVLLTYKQMTMIDAMRGKFEVFLDKNLESVRSVSRVVHQMDELLESGFGGAEAEKVRQFCEHVAFQEHEVDVLQRDLVKTLFAHEGEMSYGSFHLMNQIVVEVAALSNLSEKLANRIRMTLELK